METTRTRPARCACVGRRNATDPHSKHCDLFPTGPSQVTYTTFAGRTVTLTEPADTLDLMLKRIRRLNGHDIRVTPAN